MPAIHKLHGGSNAERWSNCAGYAYLSTQVPRKPPNQAAIKGTAQHAVMEQLLNDGKLTPDHFKGTTVLGVEMDEKCIAEIEIALESYEYILDQYPEDAVLLSERMVDLTDEAGGTFDAGIAAGEKCAIIDFKFGRNEVSPDKEQGLFYGVCARETEPAFTKMKELDVWVVQPEFDPAHVMTTYHEHQLDIAKKNFLIAINVSKQPNPLYTEGEWCEWCEAKIACPAKLGRLGTLTMPNHVLDLDELGLQLKKIKEWEKWAKDAAERIQHELEHGRVNAYWKLVMKRAINQWKSEAKAVSEFKAKGVSEDDYAPRELISPTQAKERKLLPAAKVKELASPVSSGYTIAPIDDKRPPVLPTGALAEALKKLKS